jgi:hypothetical protein
MPAPGSYRPPARRGLGNRQAAIRGDPARRTICDQAATDGRLADQLLAQLTRPR